MAVTVESVIERVKATLLEVGAEGTRWKNDELLGWLNESYQAIVGLRPDASAVNATFTHTANTTKQFLPDDGIRLLDVVRNLAGDQSAIRRIDRKQLDDIYPGWHGEAASETIEHFIFDEMDPRVFYLYPRPSAGASVEIVYSAVPDLHTGTFEAVKTENVKLDDTFAPSMVDYILFRAFTKDADSPMSASRATTHYQVFTTQLGVKSNVARAASPNPNRAQA